MRIDNPHLTVEQQLYDGEFGLFLNDCAWELQSLGAVLCDCSDDNSKDGPMLSGLRHLVGKKLEGIEVSNPSYDAVVRFEDGLELLLLCYHPDYLETTEVSYQYGFSTPEMTLGAEGTEGQWTLFVEVD
ncbi:hypothetical protein EON80_18685 [bacterium]|nr:MAG: hypothetical protein EON80_18685 [bacterium]